MLFFRHFFDIFITAILILIEISYSSKFMNMTWNCVESTMKVSWKGKVQNSKVNYLNVISSYQNLECYKIVGSCWKYVIGLKLLIVSGIFNGKSVRNLFAKESRPNISCICTAAD